MMLPPGFVTLASSFRWLTGSARYSRTPMLSTRSTDSPAASIESPSATWNSCDGKRRLHSAIMFSEMSITEIARARRVEQLSKIARPTSNVERRADRLIREHALDCAVSHRIDVIRQPVVPCGGVAVEVCSNQVLVGVHDEFAVPATMSSMTPDLYAGL